MNLPFLKKRRRGGGPAPEPTPDRTVGLSTDEQLEDQAIEELMDASENKDPKQFRSALEALVMNAFDHGDPDGD